MTDENDDISIDELDAQDTGEAAPSTAQDEAKPADPEKDEQKAESETDESAESDAEAEDDSEGKNVPKGVQRRINKITATNYELRERAAKAEREAAELRQKYGLDELKKPSLEDPEINYDQDKLEQALDKFYESKHLSKQNAGDSQPEPGNQPEKARVAVDTVRGHIGNYVAEKGITMDEYNAAVKSLPIMKDPALQSLGPALLELEDKAPAVTHYLASRLDLLEDLRGLNEVQAFKELNKISQRLTPPKPKQSQAPDPVESESTGGGAVSKNLEELDIEELDRLDAQSYG